MSSPPRFAQHLLQSQIRHRSRYTQNNSDFYQLKLQRLQQDFLVLQQQLHLARIRLRTAEDFEIKYQLLTKQNSSLLQENGKLSKELGFRKIENDKLIGEISLINISLAELNKIILTKDSQIMLLLDQIKQFQIQSQTLAIRASRMHDGEITTLKKANQDLQNVMDQYQNSSNIKVEQLIGEIQKLNNHNGNLQEEIERLTSRHGEEIGRVREENELKEKLYLQKLERERQRFEEFQRETKVREQKERRERGQGGGEQEIGFMTQQINNLTSLLKDKEQQLQGVFEQKDNNLNEWTNQKQQLRSHIRLLEQKIYQLQRQHQLQILHLKQRLTKLHAEQITQLKKNQQDLIKAMKDLKQQQILKDKDQQIIQLNEKIYSDKNLHQRDRDEILKGIETLKERIRQHNESSDNQHKILTSLNLNIEEERTSKQTDYQNNLTFLDQQLKRANLTIEQKNLEIKKLLGELNDLKTETEKDRKEMIQRAEGERKQLNQEIDQLISQRQDIEQQLKIKEKEVKVKDRQLQQQQAKSAAERKAYQRLQQQLHNDCKRMADELKLVERSARDERTKNIASVTELNNVRRQKLGDLDRQKEEFDLLYRGRMDQLKDSLNLEIDKLRVERDRLQAELVQCRLELTESQEDFKKVSSLVAQESKVNKEKLVEYQKKMATLNQEINLTQNLYNSFIDAKSRLKQSRSQKQN